MLQTIGGLVFWHTDRNVNRADLQAIAGRVEQRPAPALAGQGSVGLFSVTGSQALESTDQVWVVADQDLTNLPELLEVVGRGQGGVEVLAALYAREGPAFVRRLHGAFALALWDRRERILLLAVDRFGIKRLHYVSDGRRTAFASRARALLAAPGVEARADLTAVYNYLSFDYVPAPGSIFAGIRRVPPGHLLRIRNGEATLEPYWDMAYPERVIRKGEGAVTLYRLTEEAVGHALCGLDLKETGAFLSGGTDSSTVVGLVGRITGERVSAFSIGFREDRYDELSYARLAARHFGANHHTQIVSPGEALRCLPRLVEAYDEPFGNNSAIGTLFCAQLARDCGVTRLLAGDGGDEIFGGNERYGTDRIFGMYHQIPSILRRGLIEPILGTLSNGDAGLLGLAQRYVRRAKIPNPSRFYSYEFFFAQEADRLFAPDFLAAIDAGAPYDIIQAYYDRVQGITELNRLLYLDLKLTIGDNDLLKVTRTAELAGVTVRFPLLDLELVEFTGTLPSKFKVRGLEKRYLFKQAFQNLLPQETLTKRKHGFGVPTSVWLRSHPGFQALAQDALLSPRARHRGYFRPGAIEELFRRFGEDSTPFYGDILWTILMLELWQRRHMDGEAGA